MRHVVEAQRRHRASACAGKRDRASPANAVARVSPEQIAQWVIDNRYPKSEFDKVSDFELYHQIKEDIEGLLKPEKTPNHTGLSPIERKRLNELSSQKKIEILTMDELGEYYDLLNKVNFPTL